ncbi:MAG: PQQ-binding-like beta-propeller repeat protein [Gammaproteobacteria bacterium]|nr:PQQ-binding-like beta-propeller repeat protein [Gammaproteobacteria bacterium]
MTIGFRALALVTIMPALATTSATAQRLFSDDRAATFTADQVTRGQAAYGRVCVSCHGAALEGGQFGPTLTGDVFASHWRDRTRGEFSEHIRTTMPPGGLGSVSGQAYTDIEAYILQSNGFTAAAGAASAAVAAAPASAPDGNVAEGRPRPPVQRNLDDPLYQAAIAQRTAKLATLTPVTDDMLRDPPANDWLIWRRRFDTLGYSTLSRIDRGNVGNLRMSWSWSLPDSMNEITPLVHDGVLFVYSGPVVQALDATTGALLWQYLRILPDQYDNGRASRVKTLALTGDLLIAPMIDGHVVALNAKTGKVVWDQEVLTPEQRNMQGKAEGVALHLNGGPIVVNGVIVIGVSLGLENSPGGCFIVGLDAKTGSELWRFRTIARPGQPGGDTWNDAPVNERFGGGVWTAGSYDPELDLVYFGIGNTYDSATLLEPRPGTDKVTRNDGLYTDATVALRPATGELVWYYQHHRRDVWDLDWVFEQSLVTLPIDGKPRKLVVTAGKTAIFEALDAATGEFVFARDMGMQNLVIAIDEKTGEKTVNPALAPEAGKAKLMCPAPFGARNWPTTSINPTNGVLFVALTESCTDYTYSPRSAEETAKGGSDMRFSTRVPPGADGNFGKLAALDLNTKQIVWQQRQRVPFAGSALSTATGVLFYGDLDRHFRAYDQDTGNILWQTRLNAAPESSPITYAVNGKQYVAVVAGGGSAYGAGGRGMVPELQASAAGVTLYVFELP